ncbi:hypothetical protein H7I53_17885 [Mycolicibacterium pulveris]|nr:hypothetical protein [Mycolicibacterium pulveris]
MTRADGFDPTPVDRPIIQLAASGAAAGSNRDMPRTLSFEALLVGCTHAGVEFGLDWLACLLRAAAERDDSVLRYLSASPAHSGVDPDTLVRELHGVVLTKAPVVVQEFNTEKRRNQQATVYVVSWEMTTLSPYPYLPAVEVPVAWDEQTRQPVNYVHSPDCEKPESCIEIPVLFSTECVPEEIEVVTSPPPVCGGCMPVGEIDKYSFWVPTLDWPLRCRETAVTTIIRNLGEDALSLQAFWRECGSDVRCEESLWPLKVAGLAAGAELVLDGVTGRFWAIYKDRRHHVSGVVGTPSGAPWRPPVIDRQMCWELVVQTAANSEFDVHLTLRDREP